MNDKKKLSNIKRLKNIIIYYVMTLTIQSNFEKDVLTVDLNDSTDLQCYKLNIALMLWMYWCMWVWSIVV